MTRVFKYPLQMEQRQLLQMPHLAHLLSVAVIDGMPVLFAQIEEEYQNIPVQRVIRTSRTGERFNAIGCTFVGTLVFEEQGHTFHVYEQEEGAADALEPRFREDYEQVRRESMALEPLGPMR